MSLLLPPLPPLFILPSDTAVVSDGVDDNCCGRNQVRGAALKSNRHEWLWWISGVLTDTQGNPTHLLFPPAGCIISEHTPLPSLNIQPCQPSLLSLQFYSFHKSLFATFPFPDVPFSYTLLPPQPHHFVTEVLIISVEPWFTFPLPLFPFILPVL